MFGGGDSAGLSLAKRLHGDANRLVLPVEAGRDTTQGRLIGEKVADHLIARL